MTTSFISDAALARVIAHCQHIPLEQVSRPTLTTAEAAFYLNRKPQTLRVWASAESGPIRPLRVHGRLAWRLSDVRACLGVA